MAQSLDQVIASLNSIYQPQLQNIQDQQAQLPQQLQNDESALQGQQTNAFNDILQGARQRGAGVAFGGIPLGEQAKYTATSYMPALANLRSTYAQKGTSLQDAINGIHERQFSNANGLYQFGVQQDQEAARMAEQQREFDAQQRAASAGGFDPTFGGGADPTAAAKADPYASINKQSASNAIVGLLKTNNAGLINKTLQAISASARNGNLYDKFKLDLLKMYQTNSPYASLLSKAYGYKAPAPAPAKAVPASVPRPLALGGLQINNPLALR